MAVISPCDGIVCLARALQRSRVVLPKGRTQARASGGDGAPAPVWNRVFIAALAFSQADPERASLVRRGDVSRLFVCEICLFHPASRS